MTANLFSDAKRTPAGLLQPRTLVICGLVVLMHGAGLWALSRQTPVKLTPIQPVPPIAVRVISPSSPMPVTPRTAPIVPRAPTPDKPESSPVLKPAIKNPAKPDLTPKITPPSRAPAKSAVLAESPVKSTAPAEAVLKSSAAVERSQPVVDTSPPARRPAAESGPSQASGSNPLPVAKAAHTPAAETVAKPAPAAPVAPSAAPATPPLVEGVSYVRQPPAVDFDDDDLGGQSRLIKLKVLISASGTVDDVQVVTSSGIGSLDQRFVRAMKKAIFTPHKVNGVAVPVYTIQPFQLSLSDN